MKNKCEGCKRYSEKYDCAECKPDYKETNADKIRSMSDEELADWLTSVTDDAQLDARTKCNYQWKEWLQSEYER